MDFKMEAVEVYLGPKGHVVIRQHCGFMPSSQIILDPSQVPTVIEWMKAIAAEAACGPAEVSPPAAELPATPESTVRWEQE
jgi:hypothetical protein